MASLNFKQYTVLNTVNLILYNTKRPAALCDISNAVSRSKGIIHKQGFSVIHELDWLVSRGMMYKGIWPLTYGLTNKGRRYLANNFCPNPEE